MRRILSACVLVFLLSSIEAQAGSYLFGLTDGEIDEVLSHYYPKGYDRAEALQLLSEPFDCRNVRDLCREVGERYAYQMLETTWALARRQYPIETIDRVAQHDLELLGERWFESVYPNGILDRDPYFGEPGFEEAECDDTVSVDAGNFRITHTSRRHSLVVYAWGRVKVEHFKKKSDGSWEKAKADRLEVEGNVTVKQSGFDPVTIPVFDSRENKDSVAQSHRSKGLTIFAVPFVEGCGGVPNSLLQTCSCSGTP